MIAERYTSRRGSPRVPSRLRQWIGWKNPWMVVATLALTGWALDSLLVATEFHQVAGAGWIIHLTHLWWGPARLLIGLWLARRTFARWVHRQAPPP